MLVIVLVDIEHIEERTDSISNMHSISNAKLEAHNDVQISVHNGHGFILGQRLAFYLFQCRQDGRWEVLVISCHSHQLSIGF